MDIKLKPSSAWAHCSALPFYEIDSPLVPLQSDTREEGIACAWAAECIINNLGLVKVKNGDMAPNGVVITEHMLDNIISPYLRDINPKDTDQVIMPMRAEKRVEMSQFPTQPTVFLDCCWVSSQGVCFIRDLKAGGIYVNSEYNYQLLQYVEALHDEVDALCKAAGLSGVMGWNVGIIQPLLENYTPWCFDETTWINVHRVDLYQRAALMNNPQETAGPHCRNCKGAHRCGTLRNLGLYGASASATMNPVDAPIQVVEHEYELLTEALEAMKSRITGLKADIIDRMRQGERTNYVMSSSIGNLSYDVPVETVLQLGDDSGIDLRGKVTSKTPTQAIKAGVPEHRIKLIATRKNGKMELKKLDANLAKKTFNL